MPARSSSKSAHNLAVGAEHQAVKRYGHLFEHVIAWPNLLLAARKARRGKPARDVIQRFEFFRERELFKLQDELSRGLYRPGSFTTHWITHPKPQLISAAPYRDRVVHHAVMNVLEPILDRHFHPESYACRKGKGTHAASRRLQQLMRRYAYTLQCDVRKFFPSIDHELLKATFRRRLKDARLLALLDTFVDGSNPQEEMTAWYPGDDLFTPAERRRGLPIGNLTSQWFANWYLDAFDHDVTRRVNGYVRYCDDFVLLDGDRGRLRSEVAALSGTFAQLRLQLHAERLQVRRADASRTFVGYVTEPGRRRLLNVAVRRHRQRWRRVWAACPAAAERMGTGWEGHALQGDCRGLVAQVSGSKRFHTLQRNLRTFQLHVT